MHSSEELLDVFDSNGELLGKSKPRAQVHKTGDWHKTVHVWIISSQGELLLQKRSESKESHPGLWDISCAGHIKSGQTSTDAAIKEAREPQINGKEALKTQRLIWNIYKSARLGKRIYLN